MFVYYYVHIQETFEIVERRLMMILSGLDGMAGIAYREGEILRTRLGVGGDPALAKTVRIRVREPRRGASEIVIPVTWEASGAPGLFPSMEADIVAAALGPDLTQLAFRGSYTPPLGLVGRALDRTLLHRIAEASVKGFVDRLAHSLERDEHLEQATEGR